MTPYWPTSIKQGILINYAGSRKDTRALFETVGAPIARPRITGNISTFEMRPVPMLKSEFATFETWVSDDLKNGALAFSMRDPISDVVRLWKIAGGESLYNIGIVGAHMVQVSFSAVRLPSVPWFAPYVPEGVSRVPDFVADYAKGVYGIDGAKVGASALAGISGDFDTVTTDGSGVTYATETLAGVPTSAPPGVTSIIGFAV